MYSIIVFSKCKEFNADSRDHDFAKDSQAAAAAGDLVNQVVRKCAERGDDFFTGKQAVVVFYELVNQSDGSVVDFGEQLVKFRDIPHWDEVEEFLRRCQVEDLDWKMEDYADFVKKKKRKSFVFGADYETADSYWARYCAKLFVMQTVIELRDSALSRASIALDVQDMFTLVSQGKHS